MLTSNSHLTCCCIPMATASAGMFFAGVRRACSGGHPAWRRVCFGSLQTAAQQQGQHDVRATLLIGSCMQVSAVDNRLAVAGGIPPLSFLCESLRSAPHHPVQVSAAGDRWAAAGGPAHSGLEPAGHNPRPRHRAVPCAGGVLGTGQSLPVHQ